VSQKVIFKDCEVRHCERNKGREGTVTILGDNDVSPPGGGLLKVPPLDLANGLVDGEGHPVTRDGGVKNDVGVGEVPVHTIQGLDKVIRPRPTTKIGDVVHMDFGMRHPSLLIIWRLWTRP